MFELVFLNNSNKNKHHIHLSIVITTLLDMADRGRVAQWLTCRATNRKVAGSIPAGVTGIFHLNKILPIAVRLWVVDSTSNRNECRFLGVNAAGA